MEWNELFYKVENPVEKQDFFKKAIEEEAKTTENDKEYIMVCTDESLKNKKNSHRLFVNIPKNQTRNMNIELIYRLGREKCPCFYEYSNQGGEFVLYCFEDTVEGTIKILEEIQMEGKIDFLEAPLYTGLYNGWLGYGALKEEDFKANTYQDSRSKIMQEAMKNSIVKLVENGNNTIIKHEGRNVYLNDYLTLILLECIKENMKDDHIISQDNYDYLRIKTKDIINNSDYYLDGRYHMLLKSSTPLLINKEILTTFFKKSSLVLIDKIDNFEKLVEEEFLNECWNSQITPNNIAFDIGTFANTFEDEKNIEKNPVEPTSPQEPIIPRVEEEIVSSEPTKIYEETEEKEEEKPKHPKKRPINPNPPFEQKMAMRLQNENHANKKLTKEEKINFRQLDDNTYSITNHNKDFLSDKEIVRNAYQFLHNNMDKTLKVMDNGREKEIQIKDYFNRCLIYYGIQNIDLSPLLKKDNLKEYSNSLDHAIETVSKIIYKDSNTMANAFQIYAQSLEDFSIPLTDGKDKIYLDSNILGIIAKRVVYEFRLNPKHDHYIEDNMVLNKKITKEDITSRTK